MRATAHRKSRGGSRRKKFGSKFTPVQSIHQPSVLLLFCMKTQNLKRYSIQSTIHLSTEAEMKVYYRSCVRQRTYGKVEKKERKTQTHGEVESTVSIH